MLSSPLYRIVLMYEPPLVHLKIGSRICILQAKLPIGSVSTSLKQSPNPLALSGLHMPTSRQISSVCTVYKDRYRYFCLAVKTTSQVQHLLLRELWESFTSRGYTNNLSISPPTHSCKLRSLCRQLTLDSAAPTVHASGTGSRHCGVPSVL